MPHAYLITFNVVLPTVLKGSGCADPETLTGPWCHAVLAVVITRWNVSCTRVSPMDSLSHELPELLCAYICAQGHFDHYLSTGLLSCYSPLISWSSITSSGTKSVQGAVPVLDLPLPVVDADHVTVQCDNEICHGNPESRAQPEELWRSMEGPMLSGEQLTTLSYVPSCAKIPFCLLAHIYSVMLQQMHVISYYIQGLSRKGHLSLCGAAEALWQKHSQLCGASSCYFQAWSLLISKLFPSLIQHALDSSWICCCRGRVSGFCYECPCHVTTFLSFLTAEIDYWNYI